MSGVRAGGGKGGNVRRRIWNAVAALSLGMFLAAGVLLATSRWWSWGFSSGARWKGGFFVANFTDGVVAYGVLDPVYIHSAGLRRGEGNASFAQDLSSLGYGSRSYLGFRAGTEAVARDAFILVPYWFLLLASAILPSIWLMKRRKAQPGCCKNCGYDLRASPVRCPECGRERIG
jgi:hypothetical protein